MTKAATFVHLSDIHFRGQSGTSVHDLDADVRNELVRDAAAVLGRVSQPTGVLITGDIAFSGARVEYERAAQWLEGFCAGIGCPPENVWVVPGNHDVDRRAASGSKHTRMLHDALRSKTEDAIDSELREVCMDPQSSNALLAPLAEYNAFAARFQCSISAGRPFWERDIKLECGTILRLRGLCSVLVSNAADDKGNLLLGTAQASVPRTAGVEYLTLCHHPPDWLLDQDSVVNHLESKVRVQLFGHKHSQRLQTINETLRLIAGAMHPERHEKEWVPTYNVLEIARRDADRIGVRVFQRRWSKVDCRFVSDTDPNTSREYREYIWQGCPTPRLGLEGAVVSETPRDAISATANAVATPVTANASQADAVVVNPERRLTYRFLTLAFRHQIAVAQSLDVLTDEDRALSDEHLFRELFKRAAAAGLLAKLWDETEKRHADPATFNPFESSK